MRSVGLRAPGQPDSGRGSAGKGGAAFQKPARGAPASPAAPGADSWGRPQLSSATLDDSLDQPPRDPGRSRRPAAAPKEKVKLKSPFDVEISRERKRLTRRQGWIILMLNGGAVICFIATLVIAVLPVEQIRLVASLPAAKMTDWEVQPYVGLELVDGDQPCPTGTYDMFNRTWHGTDAGCNGGTDGVLAGEACTAAWSRLSPIGPIVQGSGLGRRICGRQGGRPFLHATRPDLRSGACPPGTEACSGYTAPASVVCYHSAAGETVEDSCPITGLSLFTATDAAPAGGEGYTTLEFAPANRTHGLYLAYTRAAADNLALTSFLIEPTPCLLPGLEYTQQGVHHWPLERD